MIFTACLTWYFFLLEWVYFIFFLLKTAQYPTIPKSFILSHKGSFKYLLIFHVNLGLLEKNPLFAGKLQDLKKINFLF